jgi:UDP-N-acetylmuramyl pentapeptide synthase
LIRNLQKPHLAILNADDAFLQKEINKKKSATVFTFGVKNQADFRAADINHLHGRLEFKVNKKYPFSTDTFGHYNTYNALAAIAACRVLGLDYKDIAGKLSSFEFPPGRLNFIELNKIKFIDDTYNSNPLSLGHALDVLGKFSSSGRRILVIGDMLELGSLSHDFHARAGKKAAVSCDVCIAVGALAQEAAEALKEHGFDLGNLFTCETSLQAREILLERVEPQENDVVLVKGSRAMRMEEVIKVLTD